MECVLKKHIIKLYCWNSFPGELILFFKSSWPTNYVLFTYPIFLVCYLILFLILLLFDWKHRISSSSRSSASFTISNDGKCKEKKKKRKKKNWSVLLHIRLLFIFIFHKHHLTLNFGNAGKIHILQVFFFKSWFCKKLVS